MAATTETGDQQHQGGRTTAPANANSSSNHDDDDDELPDYFTSEATVAWVQLMLDSWESKKAAGGEPLIPNRGSSSSTEVQQARQLANLQYAVVSHDFLRNKEDPIFIYGNL